MKNIYIHIGCGKTGSSALQLWLHQNIKSLSKADIHYPSTVKELDKYAITSGNGVSAVDAIRSGKGMEYFSELISHGQNFCLSSEAFQLLDPKNLIEFKQILQKLNVQPIIIAYVRDIYDMMYSSYLQLIKRNLFARSFRDYVLSQKSLQQFQVIERWATAFDNIQLIHYDSVKSNVAQPFCDVLHIPYDEMQPLTKIKVNRSLSINEGELVRFMNEQYVRQFGKDASAVFCEKISNALIYTHPELETEIFYDQFLYDDMEKKFIGQINHFNAIYFQGKNTIQVFRKENKPITKQPAHIPDYLLICMQELLKMCTVISPSEHSIKKPENNAPPLTEHDPRVVPLLVGSAAKREASNLNDALTLVQAAQVLRPTGTIIKAKIDDYIKRLDEKNEA